MPLREQVQRALDHPEVAPDLGAAWPLPPLAELALRIDGYLGMQRAPAPLVRQRWRPTALLAATLPASDASRPATRLCHVEALGEILQMTAGDVAEILRVFAAVGAATYESRGTAIELTFLGTPGTGIERQVAWWHWCRAVKTPAALTLLAYLAQEIDSEGLRGPALHGTFRAKAIARATGYTAPAICRAAERLEQYGAIRRLHTQGAQLAVMVTDHLLTGRPIVATPPVPQDRVTTAPRRPRRPMTPTRPSAGGGADTTASVEAPAHPGTTTAGHDVPRATREAATVFQFEVVAGQILNLHLGALLTRVTGPAIVPVPRGWRLSTTQAAFVPLPNGTTVHLEPDPDLR